jgi:hypothetical protein
MVHRLIAIGSLAQFSYGDSLYAPAKRRSGQRLTAHGELLRSDLAGEGSFIAPVNKCSCYSCLARRSFMEPFFDSCGIMRDVVISIMARLAEQERIAISERTKTGLQRAKRAGRTLGRRAVQGNLAKVERFRADGLGLRAAKLGISVNTLQKARGKG